MDAPPMPRPDPSEQSRSRRERILDAAFHAFAGRGYRDASMDDIAAAAETSKGGDLLPLPDQGVDLPRADATRPPTSSWARWSGPWRWESDPIAQAEVAIRTVLATFAGHRTMARLLFLDTIGAGRVFQAETNALHDRFAV